MKFLWSMAAAFVGALVILVFGVVYGLHLATYGRPDPGRIFAGLAFVAAGLNPIVAATFLSIRSSIGKPLGKTAKVLLWATALPWGALGVYVLWINGRRLNPELLPVLAFAVGFTASLVLYPGDRERDAGSGDHRDSTVEGR